MPRTILSSARSRERTWCSDTSSVPGSSSSSGPCRTAHGCSAKASSMPCRSDGLESVALRSLSSSEPSCPAAVQPSWALANDAPCPCPACAPFPSRPCGTSLASSPNDRRSPFRRELPAPSAARAPQSINRRRAGAALGVCTETCRNRRLVNGHFRSEHCCAMKLEVRWSASPPAVPLASCWRLAEPRHCALRQPSCSSSRLAGSAWR